MKSFAGSDSSESISVASFRPAPAPIPLVILAGADARPTRLPRRAATDHRPVAGYKGATLRIGGRTLISRLVERLEGCGAFGPILIAGPARVYRGPSTRVPVIDTDVSFDGNVRLAIETVQAEHPGAPVAFITCDVLPTHEELVQLIALYREDPGSSIWCPGVRVPEDRVGLGAFAWKPGYRLRVGPEAIVTMLPGHFAVVRPAGLRLRFLYRLARVAYRSRNRSIRFRRRFMIAQLLPHLWFQDGLELLALRPPTFTYSVVRHGWAAARAFREGALAVTELEAILTRMAVKSRYLERHPEASVRIPIVDLQGLAFDIDTEEEARQLGVEPTS
ncbi:MAG: NTP transferase domain-containing protein [Planctomycetota bacterium]